MKLALLTSWVSRRGGGIFEIVRRLAQSLAEARKADVSVFGLRDEHADADLPQWLPLVPRLFPVQGPRFFGYARQLVPSLCDANVDLINTHGLWMYPSAACVSWARRTGKPYMVSVQGMLDPWALGQSRWKKRLAKFFYENAHLRQATCLQVNSRAEAAHVREGGLENPICVIPNGVDLPPAEETPAPWQGSVEPGRKVLLFLSRIHPKKGLPNVLRAWADLHQSGYPALRDWTLIVAGWDQGGHEDELKTQARTLGIEKMVAFIGPHFNEAKRAAYRHAAAFVLPSLSEGLPMAALEAMAHGLPVLITPACNLPDVFAHGAGLSITPDPVDIGRGLRDLLDMTDAQRSAMGARGRKLVEEQFTWNRVADQMRSVYDWVLGGGKPPDYVLEASSTQ